jgi:anti-sigma regulatory factor (Ser/Thr protein kinase)
MKPRGDPPNEKPPPFRWPAKIRLPAAMENFDAFMQFVRTAAAGIGFGPDLQRKIQLACEEMVLNVINYAYPEGQPGDIELTATRAHDRVGLVVKISDWGGPFDPLQEKEPDVHAPWQERRVGGLGIFMTKKIMDQVAYQRAGERNELTLTKYRNADDVD